MKRSSQKLALFACVLFALAACDTSKPGNVGTFSGSTTSGNQLDAATDADAMAEIEDSAAAPDVSAAEDTEEPTKVVPKPEPTFDDPISQACWDLAQSVCTKILPKCGELSVVGPLITANLETCKNVMGGISTGVESFCRGIPDLAGDALDQLGPLKNLTGVFVNLCISKFECTDESVRKTISDIAPVITSLTRGETPDLTKLLGAVLNLCNVGIPGITP